MRTEGNRLEFQVVLPKLTPFQTQCLRILRERVVVIESELVPKRNSKSTSMLDELFASGLVGRIRTDSEPHYFLTEVGRQAINAVDPPPPSSHGAAGREGEMHGRAVRSVGGTRMNHRERVEQLIEKHLRQRKDKFEALSWLRASNEKSQRSLAEWTNEESTKLIEQAYGCGAKEVWAVRFDRNPPYESINTLIVTLPDKRKAREAVFRWANQQIEEQGFDPEEDYGQHHLYIWFD